MIDEMETPQIMRVIIDICVFCSIVANIIVRIHSIFVSLRNHNASRMESPATIGGQDTAKEYQGKTHSKETLENQLSTARDRRVRIDK